MPATSSFAIPITSMQRKILTGTDQSLAHLDKERQLQGSGISPFQIVRIEKHSYSMIKYTKMVMNVTFK